MTSVSSGTLCDSSSRKTPSEAKKDPHLRDSMLKHETGSSCDWLSSPAVLHGLSVTHPVLARLRTIAIRHLYGQAVMRCSSTSSLLHSPCLLAYLLPNTSLGFHGPSHSNGNRYLAICAHVHSSARCTCIFQNAIWSLTLIEKSLRQY